MYKKTQAHFQHFRSHSQKLREQAFVSLTAEALHWLGWMYANIRLTLRKQCVWQATLYINDLLAPDGSHPYKDQLLQFLTYVGMHNKVTMCPPNHMVLRSVPLARLAIETCQIAPDRPRSVPAEYAQEPAFWGAYVEQNGSPGRTETYGYLDVQGSAPLLVQLRSFAQELGCANEDISVIAIGRQTSEISFGNNAANLLLQTVYPGAHLRNTLFWDQAIHSQLTIF